MNYNRLYNTIENKIEDLISTGYPIKLLTPFEICFERGELNTPIVIIITKGYLKDEERELCAKTSLSTGDLTLVDYFNEEEFKLKITNVKEWKCMLKKEYEDFSTIEDLNRI